MAHIYVRQSEGLWYMGRTKHDDIHRRRDSRNAGPFAVDMQGNELCLYVPDELAHIAETESIQFMIGFVGIENIRNRTQLFTPCTGIEIAECL